MQKAPITKYRPFPPVPLTDRQWPTRTIERPPIWCSVDLRDGNQALAVPMSVREKLEFFQTLVEIGFKEIEFGFPSASDTEFRFARELIERNLIPDDVTIQCLVQCREHLIRRTFEAIQGARRAIVHFYNSTNPLQRRVTFGMTREQIKQIAVDGAKLVKELEPLSRETEIVYQYSPESFSDTELDYALEICSAVIDVVQPTPDRKMIINLPDTVQYAMPNVHADQIEYMCRHLPRRDSLIVSLHTHNDRGTGVAATELALLAGADRVEGTLFGNGERTGNVDIVTVALNMYMHGIDPGLDLSNLPAIREVYERCTRMEVHPRHPYAGDLAYTAFSGSHQDAIKKGLDAMDTLQKEAAPNAEPRWEVPYLPIDPEDIGRTYKAIIRINSQSGKGGVAYVMDREFGYTLPKGMHPEFGRVVTEQADNSGNELNTDQIRKIFFSEYVGNIEPLNLRSYEVVSQSDDHHQIELKAQVLFNGEQKTVSGRGNGPINALANAIKEAGWKEFRLLNYSQHALTSGSAAEAASYIQIERQTDRRQFWGVGVDANIELAGLKALVSAFNRAHADLRARQATK